MWFNNLINKVRNKINNHNVFIEYYNYLSAYAAFNKGINIECKNNLELNKILKLMLMMGIQPVPESETKEFLLRHEEWIYDSIIVFSVDFKNFVFKIHKFNNMSRMLIGINSIAYGTNEMDIFSRIEKDFDLFNITLGNDVIIKINNFQELFNCIIISNINGFDSSEPLYTQISKFKIFDKYYNIIEYFEKFNFKKNDIYFKFYDNKINVIIKNSKEKFEEDFINYKDIIGG